jgi:putative FmdB family regulatory protein
MPIYEYRCDKCGIFEVTQRITESPLRRCPTCRGKVERVISQTSFILKGSGWYASDYGRSGSSSKGESKPGEATAANGSAASGSSASSESKPSTESKPATDKSTPSKPAD